MLPAAEMEKPAASFDSSARATSSASATFYGNLGWPQIVETAVRGVRTSRHRPRAISINQLAHDGNAEPEPGTAASVSPSESWSTPPRRGRPADRTDAHRRRRRDQRASRREFFTGRSAYLCGPEATTRDRLANEPDNQS